MLFLGLDAGGSAARWAAIDERGSIILRGEANGFSGHIHDEAVKRRVEEALAALARSVLGRGSIARCHAGVTGLSADTPEAAWFADRLGGLLGCSASVEDDVSLAYRASFAPGEGVLVYAGTGSLALHMTAAGERWRAGGHGILIDDEGSAAWIAREALRRLLARDDAAPGDGWGTQLGQAFGRRFGGADWAHARVFIYGSHRGAIGQLARAVGEAAVAGDEIAAATLADAGRALAALARTLLARVGRKPVALAGGTMLLSSIIADSFLKEIGTDSEVRIVEIDAALTAARVAAQATGAGQG